MNREETYKILQNDPGNALFVGYAEDLRKEGELIEALLICLRGLSTNPSQHTGRLLLARIFYELNCTPFAVEQLSLIRGEIPSNPTLNKLISKLSGEGHIESDHSKNSKGAQDTMAEADFDISDLEALGDELNDK